MCSPYPTNMHERSSSSCTVMCSYWTARHVPLLTECTRGEGSALLLLQSTVTHERRDVHPQTELQTDLTALSCVGACVGCGASCSCVDNNTLGVKWQGG